MDALPARAEVVIVGAGFAGASTAFALARAGLRDVVLVEREPLLGAHASGRSAGLCRQLAEDDATTALTARGAAWLRDPPEGIADAPLLTRTGSMLLADDDEALAGLAARARRFAVEAETIELADVVARWPLLAGVRGAGALYVPDDGVVDTGALLHGLVAAARRAGVRLVTGAEVLGLRELDGGRGARVVTTRGAIDTRGVVDAAGAWAAELGRRAGASLELQAWRRHLFMTRPVAWADRRAPWVWHLGAEGFYVRPESGGFLLCHCDGSAHEPADVTPAADAAIALRVALTERAPRLAELPVRRAWAGLRTFADDGRMVIDWDAEVPWLFWVAGLGGHGVTAAGAVGELAAARLCARTNGAARAVLSRAARASR